MVWLALYSVLIGGVLLAIAARIARAPQERRRAPSDAPALTPPPPGLQGPTPFVCRTCGAFLISRAGPGVVAVRCTRCNRVARVEPSPTPVPLPDRSLEAERARRAARGAPAPAAIR